MYEDIIERVAARELGSKKHMEEGAVTQFKKVYYEKDFSFRGLRH